jgi:signal transduction histidine kinase
MPSTALAPHEGVRLGALRSYGILDPGRDPAFDELAELARAMLGMPVALIGFTDAERIWFKATAGLELRELPRSGSLCTHTIRTPDQVLVVPDLRADGRATLHEALQREPPLRTYVGAPLIDPDGHAIGTFCLLGHEALTFGPEQEARLRILTRQVMTLLELRRTASALAETNRQLAVSTAERTQLLAVLSQDLRAPLRSIRSIVQWTMESTGAALTPTVRGQLEEVQAQGQRMHALLDGVSTYARAGISPSTARELDPRGAVERVRRELPPGAGLQLDVGDLPRVTVDPVALEIVFQCLLDNAVRHHDRPEKRVSVGGERHPEAVVFRVEDDGPGVPAYLEPRLFRLFQTAQRGAGPTQSGIGLALVAKLVQAWGGRTRYVPTLGRGARFEFSVPGV